MKKLTTLFCLAFFMVYAVRAQTPKYFNYSVKDGLPSSETYDVIQDSKGFIWIGTDRGVVRYDGYTFKVFTTNDGLPSNTIFSIKEDASGKIWFLAYHSHLAYFYQGKIYPYRFNTVLEKEIPGTPNPRNIYFDSDQGIYINYDLYGLVHIDREGNFNPLLQETGNSYQILVLKKNGLCMWGSWLARTIEKKTQLTIDDGQTLTKHVYNTPSLGEVYHLIGLHRKNGKLILTTTKKLLQIDFNVHSVEQQSLERDFLISRLYEDRDSCLWVACIHGGVKKLFPNSTDLHRSQLQLLGNKSVTGILRDRDGGFWFTTLESGIYYFPQFRFLRANTPMTAKGIEVISITGDSTDHVFVGYRQGIVEEMEGTSFHKSINLNPGKDSSVYLYSLLYENKTGNLWYAHNKGLSIYRPQGGSQLMWPSHTRVAFKLTEDRYIFSGSFFLSEFSKNRFTNISKEVHLYTEDIGINSKGEILLAAATGLYVCDKNKVVKPVDNFLSRVRVREIKRGSNNKIIYATLGKGVVIEQNGKFRIIDERKGMASNFVNALVYRNDTIWAATTKGISCLVLHGNKTLIRNFDQYNGVPANEIKKMYQQGNIIWLGAKDGLYWFDSRQLKTQRKGPAVFLDQVKVNEHPVVGRQRFSSWQNNFNFNFFAIDYRLQGNILYRYRLKGYNDHWEYTNHRNVSYLSLPYGEYCFEVQARNADHYWSSAVTAFSFRVFKPFYLEWWFILCSAGLLVAIVWLIIRRRIINIRKNNEIVLLMNEYKSIALASQINPHFIFNSLNSIQSFIIHEDRISASKYLSAFARLMRRSLEHSRIDFVPVHAELELLEMYLSLETLRFKNKFTYSFETDILESEPEMHIPAMIFQPFIENSIKHGLIPKSGNEGKVIVRIVHQDNLLRCEVEDNGIGRKPKSYEEEKEKDHKSHGMDITVERIKTYCRNERTPFFFMIEDRPNDIVGTAGTKVIFYLPYRVKTKP